MFIVILVMLAGILTGFALQKIKIPYQNTLILTLVWGLLFLLGVEVGNNKQVINQFHTLGFDALLIAFFATLGSVIAARLIQPPTQTNSETAKKFSIGDLRNIRGSLIILLFFAIGLIAGLLQLIPAEWLSGELSYYVLCILMFSVGFSLGHQPQTIKQFRQIPPKTMLLPLGTITGTWLGALIVAWLLPYKTTESLAISSGFGYYSLSGILITQYKGATLGTIALLTNILRELITLIFAPLIARYFGKLAPIAAGGATTMDTTFPIILQTSGKEYAIIAIYSGFIVDFSVPFLVSLWCNL
jgi:uncharacterized membrane protein YbjE (DUF340 family)